MVRIAGALGLVEDSPVAMKVMADAARCIRCGSCAILVPGVFSALRRVQIVRQPETDGERSGCRAAEIVCPTAAIHTEEAPCRT